MRDVGKHGVARASDRFEFGLIPDDLHLKSLDRTRAGDDGSSRLAAHELQTFNGFRTAVGACPDDRAVYFAGTLAVLIQAGFEEVAAEAADGVCRGDAEELRGLRVQVTDGSALVDRVDAFDDAAQHSLRLAFTAAQCASELDQVVSHVFHGARERADFGHTGNRDRRREVTLSKPGGGSGQRLDGPGNGLAENEAGKNGQRGEHQGRHQQSADQSTGVAVDRCGRQEGIQQRDGLTGGRKNRCARGVLVLRVDSLHGGASIGQGCGVEARVVIDRSRGECPVVDDTNFQPHMLAQGLGELLVQQQHTVNARALRIAQRDVRAQYRIVAVGREPHEGRSLFGTSRDGVLPIQRGPGL